jgi:hypothetical protein
MLLVMPILMLYVLAISLTFAALGAIFRAGTYIYAGNSS